MIFGGKTAPKMEAKADSGAPWGDEISLENSSGALPEDSNDCRPRGAPVAFWEPPGKAPGGHFAVKSAPEASRSNFGTQIAAKWIPDASFLKLFWPPSASILARPQKPKKLEKC